MNLSTYIVKTPIKSSSFTLNSWSLWRWNVSTWHSISTNHLASTNNKLSVVLCDWLQQHLAAKFALKWNSLSHVWTIIRCLRLGHETVVCAVCVKRWNQLLMCQTSSGPVKLSLYFVDIWYPTTVSAQQQQLWFMILTMQLIGGLVG